MNKSLSNEKRPWRAPEIVEVGAIVDVTEGQNTNVNDNPGSTPISYDPKGPHHDPGGDLDLES
jgi:hypothetical protein